MKVQPASSGSAIFRSDRRSFLQQASLLAAVIAATPRLALSQASSLIAETTNGKVRGVEQSGCKFFRGIPYGGSTAGKNRFLPPTKVTSWSGVRDATNWGHISPQRFNTTNVSDYTKMVGWNDDPGGMSEECLNLNVNTPALRDGGKRTVMVSFHGGGFTSGSGNLAAFESTQLVKTGNVVVVTVTHRLGALGYTDLSGFGVPEFACSGVAGMMDCVASLEWVRDNIENFGGDPNSVMIFGQSGGGGKVSTLMSMPSARGLFHRAAVQSGSTLRLTHHEAGAKSGEELLAKLGLDESRLSEIQAIPFEKIVAAQGNGGPVVDGKVIPRDPFEPTAPEVSANVPMIMGTCLEDAGLSMTDWDLDEAGLKTWTESVVPGKSGEVLAAYRKIYPSKRPFLIKAMIATDRGGRRNAVTQAQRKLALGHAPAYLYRWDWPTPADGGKFGAVHGTDLSMSFRNADTPVGLNGSEARKMADRLGSAWIAFAKTGDPNNKEIPHWPAYNTTQRPSMIFDNNIRVENDTNHDLRILWDQIESSKQS